MHLATHIPALLGALFPLAFFGGAPPAAQLDAHGTAVDDAHTLVASYSDAIGAAMFIGGELVTIAELQYGLDDRGFLIPARISYIDSSGASRDIDNTAHVTTFFNDCTSISGAMMLGLDHEPVMAYHLALGRTSRGILVAALIDDATLARGAASVFGAGPPACEHPAQGFDCFNTGDCCDGSGDDKCSAVTGPGDTFSCSCSEAGVANTECRAVFTLICPPDGDCGSDTCVPKKNSQTTCLCASI